MSFSSAAAVENKSSESMNGLGVVSVPFNGSHGLFITGRHSSYNNMSVVNSTGVNQATAAISAPMSAGTVASDAVLALATSRLESLSWASGAATSLLLPLELKTSRPGSLAHSAQAALYTLLLGERYAPQLRGPVPASLLWAMRDTRRGVGAKLADLDKATSNNKANGNAQNSSNAPVGASSSAANPSVPLEVAARAARGLLLREVSDIDASLMAVPYSTVELPQQPQQQNAAVPATASSGDNSNRPASSSARPDCFGESYLADLESEGVATLAEAGSELGLALPLTVGNILAFGETTSDLYSNTTGAESESGGAYPTDMCPVSPLVAPPGETSVVSVPAGHVTHLISTRNAIAAALARAAASAAASAAAATAGEAADGDIETDAVKNLISSMSSSTAATDGSPTSTAETSLVVAHPRSAKPRPQTQPQSRPWAALQQRPQWSPVGYLPPCTGNPATDCVYCPVKAPCDALKRAEEAALTAAIDAESSGSLNGAETTGAAAKMTDIEDVCSGANTANSAATAHSLRPRAAAAVSRAALRAARRRTAVQAWTRALDIEADAEVRDALAASKHNRSDAMGNNTQATSNNSNTHTTSVSAVSAGPWSRVTSAVTATLKGPGSAAAAVAPLARAWASDRETQWGLSATSAGAGTRTGKCECELSVVTGGYCSCVNNVSLGIQCAPDSNNRKYSKSNPPELFLVSAKKAPGRRDTATKSTKNKRSKTNTSEKTRSTSKINGKSNANENIGRTAFVFGESDNSGSEDDDGTYERDEGLEYWHYTFALTPTGPAVESDKFYISPNTKKAINRSASQITMTDGDSTSPSSPAASVDLRDIYTAGDMMTASARVAPAPTHALLTVTPPTLAVTSHEGNRENTFMVEEELVTLPTWAYFAPAHTHTNIVDSQFDLSDALWPSAADSAYQLSVHHAALYSQPPPAAAATSTAATAQPSLPLLPPLPPRPATSVVASISVLTVTATTVTVVAAGSRPGAGANTHGHCYQGVSQGVPAPVAHAAALALASSSDAGNKRDAVDEGDDLRFRGCGSTLWGGVLSPHMYARSVLFCGKPPPSVPLGPEWFETATAAVLPVVPVAAALRRALLWKAHSATTAAAKKASAIVHRL